MSKQVTLTQKRSRDALEKLLEEVGINFFAVDTTGKIVSQNKAMLEYTDGKQNVETIDPTAWADCQTVMANKTVQTREEVYHGHTFQSFKKPVMDEDGNVLGVIGIAINITARKAAENIKVHFIESITPQFRLPCLNILSLVNEHLTDHAETFYSSVHYELCSAVAQIAMRGLKDVDSLINYAARLNRSTVEYQPIELASFCKSVIECYEFMARKAGVRLHLQINDNLPRTIVSSQRDLMTLLSCLIDNAIKFREEGGKVSLTVEAVGDKDAPMLRWRVQDDGIGIEAAHQKKIFGHFERAASKKRYPGIGLGLSKVKDCIDRLNGVIEVTSQPGAGSCFSCLIPLIEESLPAQPKRVAPHLHHVLLIEEESALAHEIESRLKKLSCQVDIATQEARILDAVKRGGYDLVFLSLTDESANTIVGRICDWEAMHNKRPLPIIGLTTQPADMSLLSVQLAARIKKVLVKPLTDKDALSALKACCEKKPPLKEVLPSAQPIKTVLQG